MLKRIFFKNSALKFVKNFRNFCTEIDEVDEITSPGLLKKASFKESSYGQVQKFKLNFNTKTSKEKRSELLKREISSNPEFIKAFPHLKEAIKIENLEEKDEDVKSFIKSNFTIQETTESREKKTDYFQSMLNKHKGYSKVLKENNEEENDSISELVDGYHTRTGPIKFMTREEKEKIHLEIDKKMRELEESGLSRQEILLGKAEGIPLKEDKFFQFIKNEKMAREMLVKPTETFSLDLVIDRALKQDIGPDPSLALTRKDFKLNEDLPVSYAYNKYKEKFNNKNPNLLLKDDDFDYTENYEDKLKLELNKEKRKPVTFIDSPLTRPELRRKYMIKTIQSKDITWKNLPLLCRFLNEGGKIMNRYQTRLPALIHKKLARTIKHARNMGLLPNSDFLRSYHKLPFTSIYNEFYQDVSRIIDKKTGLIKIVHQPTLQDKYSYSSYSSAVESNLNRNDYESANKFKEALILDKSEIPRIPSPEQRTLLLAHNHLIKVQTKNTDSEVFGSEKILNEQEKSSYEQVFQQISKNTSPSTIIESYISEKSYDVEQLKLNGKTFVDENVKKSEIKQEISKTMEKINNIIMKYQIDKLKPLDYQSEAKKFKNYKLEPRLTQKDMNTNTRKLSRKNYKI